MLRNTFRRGARSGFRGTKTGRGGASSPTPPPTTSLFSDNFNRSNGEIGNLWLGTSNWKISDGQAVNSPISGADVITNGGFDADSDWTKGTGWTISGGHAVKSPGSAASLDQVVGAGATWYQLFYTITLAASTITPRFGSATFAGVTRSSSGSYAETGITTNPSANFPFVATATTDGTVDDVSAHPLSMSQLLNLYRIERSEFSIQTDVTRVDGYHGGVALNWDSQSNPQSGVIAVLNRVAGAISAVLYKYVAGVMTSVRSGTIVYSAGAPLKVVKSGTVYQLFYNNAQVGANATISNAEIVDNPYHGIFATNSNVQLDNFSIN